MPAVVLSHSVTPAATRPRPAGWESTGAGSSQRSNWRTPDPAPALREGAA